MTITCCQLSIVSYHEYAFLKLLLGEDRVASHAGAVLIDGGHGITQKRGNVVDVGYAQAYEGKDAELGRETTIGLGFELVLRGKEGIEVLNEVGMEWQRGFQHVMNGWLNRGLWDNATHRLNATEILQTFKKFAE